MKVVLRNVFFTPGFNPKLIFHNKNKHPNVHIFQNEYFRMNAYSPTHLILIHSLTVFAVECLQQTRKYYIFIISVLIKKTGTILLDP